ncbi:MAG: DUF2070 family protein [Candidatus Odinarchaeum yellowstonii]|uniref:DUF2070 family protein n=1 Tax=Odinarchaeota yellowstonii (strain LCB_4) TaxID=1841599 RepID=A0AAF0IC30_ODILC|nr:MAG: DUF2070 family protein [Candidatus Odinarchaeum yellowstonii]
MSDEVKTEVEKAPSFYSILFQFPSFKKLILIGFTSSVILCVIAELIAPSFNPLMDLYYGVLDGIIIFFIPALISALISFFILKKDTHMLNLRRLIAISTIETFIWGGLYITGAIIYLFTVNSALLVYSFCFGGALVLTLRLLVFLSISFSKWWINLLLSLLRTILSMGIALILLITPLSSFLLNSSIWIPGIITASFIMGASVYMYKYIVDSKLKKRVGVKSTAFLKAFMASWLEDDNRHLETLFDSLGETRDIEIGLLVFKDVEGKKTSFIIPQIHPGPFRSVGSSNLPWQLSAKLEGLLVDAALVFHGPSTHASNLVKSETVNMLVDVLKERIGVCPNQFNLVSKFIRKQNRQFEVGCQFFGDLALVTAFDKTDTEDITPIVVDKLRDRLKVLGVNSIILIDAHNNKTPGSKRQPISESDEVNRLLDVLEIVVKEAFAQPKSGFKIGSNRLVFDRDLKANGIGDSGIATTILESENQRMVYVLIDGNNMVAGLRDKIREVVLKEGYDECEVMTTDTHSVDGITLRTSNLVGLHYPEKELLKNILESVRMAEKNLKNAGGCYSIFKINDVRVAGPSVEDILKGTGDAINAARTTLPPILLSAFLLIAVVYLLISIF